MNQTVQRALEIVKRNEYNIAALLDLQFMIDAIPKSAISIIDPKSRQRLQRLKRRVEEITADHTLGPHHYMYLMMIANQLIHDDHTNVFINQIPDSKLMYGRFIANYEEGKVRIVHSTDSRIQVGDCILKINDYPVTKYAEDLIKWIAPVTENKDVNMRRVCTHLCIYNPFSPVKSLQLDSGKTVSVQYHKAKRGLFGKQALQSLVFKMIYKKFKEEQLGVYALQDAGLLYFDLHTFMAQNKELPYVAHAVSAVKMNWVKWIVLDMRSNFGGSLIILNQFIKHLYGDKLLNQLQSCTVNRYAANDMFLKQYYDEVILPMLNDKETPQHMKKKYRDVFRLLQSYRDEGEFCDNKPPESLCSKDLLKGVQRKVAKGVLKGSTDKRLIIITDSHCYSACVWTSKFLSRMPNTILIGKGISNTNFSGNSVQFDFPSGKGAVSLPQVTSQLHNNSIKNAIQDEVYPDYILSQEHLSSKKKLIISLLTNRQLFDSKIRDKCRSVIV